MVTITNRIGLESSRMKYVPAEGELIVTSDTKKIYVGDGSTPGGLQISIAENISSYARNPRINENISEIPGYLWINTITGELFTLKSPKVDDNEWVGTSGKIINKSTQYDMISELSAFKTLVPLDDIYEDGAIKDVAGNIVGTSEGIIAELIDGVGNTKSVYLDGTDYIEFNDDPILYFANNEIDKTVGIWIYPTELPTEGNYFSIMNRGIDGSDISMKMNSDGTITLRSDNTNYTTTATINTNAWNFVGFTKEVEEIKAYGKSNCNIEVLVNSKIENVVDFITTPSTEVPFRLGADSTSFGLIGYLSHFVIFDAVLYIEDIAMYKNAVMYNKGLI